MEAKKKGFFARIRQASYPPKPSHRVARCVFRGSLHINDRTDLQNIPRESWSHKYTEWDDLGLTDIFDGRILEVARQKLHRHICEIWPTAICCICPTPLFSAPIDVMRKANDLYEKMKQLITNIVSRIFEQFENMSGLNLLSIYYKSWKKFRIGASEVNDVCYYLNNHMDSIGLYSTRELCLIIWKEAFQRTGTEIRVTNAILNLIHQARTRSNINRTMVRVRNAILNLIHKGLTGSNINGNIIQDVLQSYVELNIHDDPFFDDVYVKRFENKFLQTTADYYRAEAGKIKALSRAEYLSTVDKWIIDEAACCARYLLHITEPKLRKIMENVLIKPFFLPRVLHQIQSNRFSDDFLSDDWARVHSLNEHDDELVKIQKALEQHFTRGGLEAIERAKETIGQDTMLYIAKLKIVIQQQSNLVKYALNNHYEAIGALDKAAEIYVNRNAVTSNKSSEMLAKYCDQLLKKSVRTDIEFDALLDQAVLLFKYLEDKDIFLKIYTRLLSKRLIDEASVETENSFIGKLTLLCGSEYTQRMCTMLNDAQISKDLTADFRAISYQDFELPDFRVTVANTGSWPTMSPTSFQLPKKLGQCIDEFTRFYNEKYNGRKLTWMLSQSRGELYCNGFKSRKIFIATTAQLLVLLLYNDSLTYTAKSIDDRLLMDKKTSAQTIASLIKSKVLLGDVLGGKDDDVKEISLNQEYNNRKYKIDLSKAGVRADPILENQGIAGIIAEDRKYMLQACVVRIMKTKRTLSHKLLVAEVLQEMSLHFKPKIDLVKRCIEQLIEKEYVRRSEKQTDLYEYIA